MPREIEFSAGSDIYAGIVLDAGQARTILVLPDWRGYQTDYALRRGEELSRELGCNVVLGDLFGTEYRPKAYGGDAELWVSRALADPVALRSKLTGYIAALAAAADCRTSDMAVVGYCLGGALAFEMGRAGCGLSAVASVHGIPSSTAPIGRMDGSTRFVAIHGASDPIIGMDHLTAFQHEMTKAGADWISIALGHARHGFTDEEGDPHGAYQRYDASAARLSLNALKLYLEPGAAHDTR